VAQALPVAGDPDAAELAYAESGVGITPVPPAAMPTNAQTSVRMRRLTHATLSRPRFTG
jgi:hypothetical protein